MPSLVAVAELVVRVRIGPLGHEALEVTLGQLRLELLAHERVLVRILDLVGARFRTCSLCPEPRTEWGMAYLRWCRRWWGGTCYPAARVVSFEVHAHGRTTPSDGPPRQDGLMEHGPHPGFLTAIGIWTAIQVATIAVAAYLMLREQRRARSR